MRHNHDTICPTGHRIDRQAYSSAQISAVYTSTSKLRRIELIFFLVLTQ